MSADLFERFTSIKISFKNVINNLTMTSLSITYFRYNVNNLNNLVGFTSIVRKIRNKQF